MFGRPIGLNPDLDVPIMQVLDAMKEMQPDHEEYPLMISHLERLVELKKKKKQPISLDNALVVAGNLLGILVIVAYEQKHVFVSKAQGLILKPKT